MSTPQTSLSVLQSLAQQPQGGPGVTGSQGTPDQSGQSSLDVLRSIAGQAKMVDQKGNISYVDSQNIDAARQQGKMVTPDSGVKMITPNGQITYALPQEVNRFQQSGHVLVNKDGTYNVSPIPGEANVDTMARAARIAKGYADQKQAEEAEKKTYTTKRIAGTLAAAPAMGFLGTAAIAGAGEAPGLARAGYSALTAPTAVTSTVGTGIYDLAGNEITRQVTSNVGPSILKQVATSPMAIKAYKALGTLAVGTAIAKTGIFKGLLKDVISAFSGGGM